VKEFYPVVKREVLSKDVAKDVANIMVDVIEEGTGREAKVAGYRIAGKTGTAEKAVSGCYDPERVIASFVGWFPVEEPSVFILVAIDEPKAIQRYGGLISAPVFAEIAERIIVLKGVERKD
jgi:stage V sporulation protein D (sporulation-specific penicillin-binding protein)